MVESTPADLSFWGKGEWRSSSGKLSGAQECARYSPEVDGSVYPATHGDKYRE